MEGVPAALVHRLKSQISYLIYPDFDRKPHPALQASVINRLSRLHVDYRSFVDSDNPPILHRKEAFVRKDYPGYEKFLRLTRQEEKAGLLNQHNIGNQREWGNLLSRAGLTLKGHRLVRVAK